MLAAVSIKSLRATVVDSKVNQMSGARAELLLLDDDADTAVRGGAYVHRAPVALGGDLDVAGRAEGAVPGRQETDHGVGPLPVIRAAGVGRRRGTEARGELVVETSGQKAAVRAGLAQPAGSGVAVVAGAALEEPGDLVVVVVVPLTVSSSSWNAIHEAAPTVSTNGKTHPTQVDGEIFGRCRRGVPTRPPSARRVGSRPPVAGRGCSCT